MIAGTFLRFLGASGVIKMTAPFPAREVPELPIMLVASTVANTLEPHGRLNGATVKAITGTRQEEELITAAEVPSQSDVDVYVSSSLCLIFMI